jgi:hypothetical protein
MLNINKITLDLKVSFGNDTLVFKLNVHLFLFKLTLLIDLLFLTQYQSFLEGTELIIKYFVFVNKLILELLVLRSIIRDDDTSLFNMRLEFYSLAFRVV